MIHPYHFTCSIIHSIRCEIAQHHKVVGFVLDNFNLSILDFENLVFHKRNPDMTSNPNDSSSV